MSAKRKTKEPWRDLKVGDRVRIVRLPSGIDERDHPLPVETRRLYNNLITRRRSVRVSEIDEWGFPWIFCKFRQKRGQWEYHWLAINDDSWVRVIPRGLRKKKP